MSIRRRINTINTSPVVDILVTNNSNDANITGSLRWAINQASSTEPTVIKIAPNFIDLAGVGRNMHVTDSKVSGLNKNVTVDFNYTNVIIGTNGGFQGAYNIADNAFKLKNMVIENQDFGNNNFSLFEGMIEYTNCRLENLMRNASSEYFYNNVKSTITNCTFKNVVSTHNNVFNFDSGQHTIDNCIFDNTTGIYAGTATVNFSRCYISVSGNFIRYNGSPTFNFSQCHVRNSGTNTAIALMQYNYGAITNCTVKDMRITTNSGSGDKPCNIRHCTQIYTLPIDVNTVLNVINASLANTIQNNIFISPNSNNIFGTDLTGLTESNNLYLCVNSNAKFSNSTHYGATTPLTTLIDVNEQGVGYTFKRYYLPTLTNNVARLANVLQNQIEQNRTNPTNIGAI